MPARGPIRGMVKGAAMGEGLRLQANIQGDRDKLQALPETARKILTDFEHIHLEVTSPHMDSHIRAMFARQGAPAGLNWADYSGEPKYEAYKRKMIGKDNPADYLLRWHPPAKERFYPSLTDPTHSEYVEFVQGKAYERGTLVPYAYEIAVTGGVGPFGERFPGRPVLEHSDDNLREYQDKVNGEYRSQLEAEDIL